MEVYTVQVHIIDGCKGVNGVVNLELQDQNCHTEI